MRRLLAVALSGMLLSGCALSFTPHKPVVDLKATDDPIAYQRDLIECVTLADYYLTSEVNFTQQVVRETLIGGATSAVSSAIMSGSSAAIASGMTTGLIGGVVGGYVNASREETLAKNRGAGRCLQGRGYEVINAKSIYLDAKGWCMFAHPDIHPLGLQVEEWMNACISSQAEWLRKARETRLERDKARAAQADQKPAS